MTKRSRLSQRLTSTRKSWSTRKSSRQLKSRDSESPEDREERRPQVRDPEHRDAFCQLDQPNKHRQPRRAEGSRTEHYGHSSSKATTKKHRERQIFHCFSTLTRPSMSQLQNNAEKKPQRQHEDCMTKYNDIEMDKKMRQHKLRTENKKENDTAVINREVKGRTKTKCYLKESQSESSETRRRKDLVKEHSEFDSVTFYCTSENGCSQTKLTCQEHVPERIVEQIIEVQVPLPILEKTVAEMKLAP